MNDTNESLEQSLDAALAMLAESNCQAPLFSPQKLPPRFRSWWAGLTDTQELALHFGLYDLRIAVGGSRDFTELRDEYVKKLPTGHPRKIIGKNGLALAAGDISRMFMETVEFRNAYTMHLVKHEKYRNGRSGRVSLTDLGLHMSLRLKNDETEAVFL